MVPLGQKIFRIVGCAIVLPWLVLVAVVARLWRWGHSRRGLRKPRLVWAGVPLLSLVHTSVALKNAGYDSITVASDRYPTADDAQFDFCVPPKVRSRYPVNAVLMLLRGSWIFSRILFERDVLHGFFNGGVLGRTPLAEWEYWIWKVSGGELILMPYGSDGFVYRELPSTDWAQALKKTYPRTDVEDERVGMRIKRFTSLADVVVGCVVHNICLPRVDVLTVVWYPANLDVAVCLPKTSGPLKIAHAANHSALKGTQSLRRAVKELHEKGEAIELTVIENGSHQEVLTAFRNADVVVDQLLFGYALTALEGMSFGKPVISGISDDAMYAPFREHSYLDQAPIIPATPETIKCVLQELLTRREDLPELGRKSRHFVETYHSNRAAIAFFSGIYEGILPKVRSLP